MLCHKRIVIVVLLTSLVVSAAWLLKEPDSMVELGSADRTVLSTDLEPDEVIPKPTETGGATESLVASDSPQDSRKSDRETQRDPLGQSIRDPWMAYIENIEAAAAGDPAAQYKVSKTLFACKGLPSQARLDALVGDGTLDGEMGQSIQIQLDTCQQLIDTVPGDLATQSRHWLAEAVDAGYTPALGRDVIFNMTKYDVHQAEEIMQRLILERGTEKFFVIASYFVNFKEEQEDDYEAWSMLACKTIPNCIYDEYRGDYDGGLMPDDRKRIEELASAIEDAIERGEFDRIRF